MEIVLFETLSDSFSMPLNECFEKSSRFKSFNKFNVLSKRFRHNLGVYKTGPEFLISSETSNFEMFSLNLVANSSAA